MDPVTHVLSGLAVAHAGFRQRIGRTALVAVTAGALAPDLDNIIGLWDQFAAIKYHRGLTHSLFGGILLALLLAWPISRWGGSGRYRDIVRLVYLGLAAWTKAVAQARFAAELRQRVIAPDQMAVIPRLFSPFRWVALAEARDRFFQATVTPWPGTPVDLRLYTKPASNVYVEKSDAEKSVRLFRSVASFLWTRHLQRTGEHIVEYRDLRFSLGAETTMNDMVLRVVMDPAGVVKIVHFNHRF